MSHAFHRAVMQGDLEEVRRLVEAEGVDVDCISECGNTPLFLAASYGELQIARFLLEVCHANVNYINPRHGHTALLIATDCQDTLCIVPMLLQFGANVNPPLKDNFNPPLVKACRFAGASKVIQLLLEHGADVDAKGKYGQAAIHVAARKSDEATVRLLMTYGADVNALDDYHETPLFIAAERGNTNVVQALIDGDAKLDVVSGDGLSVLQCCAKDADVDIFSMLLDRCYSTMSEDEYNSLLLDDDHYGNTALHLTSSLEAAKLLVEQPRRRHDNQLLSVCRAQLIWKNRRGSTPRECALDYADEKLKAAYLETFESLVLSVSEGVTSAAAAAAQKPNDDLIAVKLNPTLNDFQRSVALEAFDLIMESTDMPDAMAHAMMGYLSPMDVMKRK